MEAIKINFMGLSLIVLDLGIVFYNLTLLIHLIN